MQRFGISHDDNSAQDTDNVARVVKESGASRVKSFINETQANSTDTHTNQGAGQFAARAARAVYGGGCFILGFDVLVRAHAVSLRGDEDG